MSKRKATDAGAADEEDNLLHTHCTHIGSRPAQEDRLTIVDDGWSVAPDSADWPRCRFYAVFDGHLGGAAAEAASFVLWSHLQPALIALQRRSPSGDDAIEGDAPSSEALALSADGGAALPSAAAGVAAPPLAAPPSAEALKAAMREAFRATEQQLLEQADEQSGSTAVCVLLLGNQLVVGHVGDSRAVLCHAERTVRLTEDHKPNVPAESARILAAGGHVTTPYARGTENVPRLNGVFSVSRALGDAPFKLGAEGGAALSAEPDLKVLTTSEFDTFVLLATDGLWDVFSDHQAVAVVLEELGVRWPRKTLRARAQAASDRLVREALLSGRCSDNVSVVLALLRGAGEP